MLSEVRVLCLVSTMLNKQESREAVMKTWGRKCTHLVYFCGGTRTIKEIQLSKNTILLSLPTTQLYENKWKTSVLAFQYIFQKYYDSFDWLIKCDDDTFVIMENLRFFLIKTNSSSPYFYGMKVRQPSTGEDFLSGGPGYVMSDSIFKKLVLSSTLPECSTEMFPAQEGLQLARCLKQVWVCLICPNSPTVHMIQYSIRGT